MGLSEEPLTSIPDFEKASIAVLMVRKGSDYLKAMLKKFVNNEKLLAHQTDVISGKVIPTY